MRFAICWVKSALYSEALLQHSAVTPQTNEHKWRWEATEFVGWIRTFQPWRSFACEWCGVMAVLRGSCDDILNLTLSFCNSLCVLSASMWFLLYRECVCCMYMFLMPLCIFCNFSVLQIQSEGKYSEKRTQEKLSLLVFFFSVQPHMGELVKGSTDLTK